MIDIIFQGIAIPRIVSHGTTEQFIDWYTQPDGSYRTPISWAIWATRGNDTRGWPKNMQPGWRSAVMIIDTLKAYQGLADAFPHSSVRFNYLPAGSFKVLRSSELDFESSSEYFRKAARLERQLLE